MRRFMMYATAALVASTAAVVVAQQVTAPADLDATMKRVGPAVGAAGKAVASKAYVDARMQIPIIRTALMEAEAFFASRKKEDAITFAKDALARVDALDKVLATAAATSAAQPPASVVDTDAAMKRVGPAAGAAGKAIASMAYADARMQLAAARTGIMEIETFFTSGNSAEGVNFARAALAKLDALDKILAAPAVDQSAAQGAMKDLQGACGACHMVFRTGDENMNFVLKPGSVPTAEQMAAQAAMRELQGACVACHNVYRGDNRGEWILKPGSI